MSEETQMSEAATEEQVVDEEPKEEEVAAVEQEEEVLVGKVVATLSEDHSPADEGPTVRRVEGPANFNRSKQGSQRRNPRHVGNDVRLGDINYKNVQVLSRFVDNYGRIHNRRKTRVSAKMQRKVTRAIKRARHLALMPYTGEHMRITNRRTS